MFFFPQLFEIYELIIISILKGWGLHFLVFCYYLHSGACFITNHIPFLYVQTYISRPSSSIQIVIPRSVYHSVNKNCYISSYYNICSNSDFFFFDFFLQLLHAVSYRSTFGHALEHPLLIMNEFCTFSGL